MMFAMKVV
jgi:hypothetical protein